MPLTKLNTSMDNVQGLDNQPTQDPTSVKQTFDKAGNDIKGFINDSLIAELESIQADSSGADCIGASEIAPGSGTKVMAILKWLYTQITNLVLGQIPDGGIADAKLSNTEGQIKDKVAKHLIDYSAFKEDAEDKLGDYNSYASAVDANGVYTVVDYKRADGTLYMKSTLSGGTSPNYTTDTWQFYNDAGTTVILTKTWTIAYDANGKITSKVVA
jgi:methionine synthase I (cobalamin-dependent)